MVSTGDCVGCAGVAGWLLLAGIPVTMFALFFFYPVGSLIGRGLAPGRDRRSVQG